MGRASKVPVDLFYVVVISTGAECGSHVFGSQFSFFFFAAGRTASNAFGCSAGRASRSLCVSTRAARDRIDRRTFIMFSKRGLHSWQRTSCVAGCGDAQIRPAGWFFLFL